MPVTAEAFYVRWGERRYPGMAVPGGAGWRAGSVRARSRTCGRRVRDVAGLSAATTRDAVTALVRAAYPDATEGKVSNFSGQWRALRSRISSGYLIVLPLKTTSQIAIGRCTGGYQYRADPDPERRHVIPVE